MKYISSIFDINISDITKLIPAIIAMACVILLSNILVQIPVDHMLLIAGNHINLANILTWGAFSYPIIFLVTDATNRIHGIKSARIIVYIGFITGVILSLIFADKRIALASGTAFLISQMLDIFLFDKLRNASWWKAPVISSLVASFIDTIIFFSLAFAGTGWPWINWALGDFTAKLIMIAILLYPFKLLVTFYPKPSKATP